MSKQSLYTGDIRPESVGGPYPYAVVYIDNGHAGGYYEVHNVKIDTVMRTRHMGPVWQGGAEEAGNIASQARQGCYENPMFWAPRVTKNDVHDSKYIGTLPSREVQACGTPAFEADLLELMQRAQVAGVQMIVNLRPIEPA